MKNNMIRICLSCLFCAGLASCGAAADKRNTQSLALVKPAAASEIKCAEENLRPTCIESNSTVGYCIRWGLAGCDQKTVWKLGKDEAWESETTGVTVGGKKKKKANSPAAEKTAPDVPDAPEIESDSPDADSAPEPVPVDL